MKPLPILLGSIFGYLICIISVQASDYPLTIALGWSIGDRGTTVSTTYEIQSADDGILKVDEKTNAGFQLLQGYVRLRRGEIMELSADEKRADIWSLPEKVPESRNTQKGASGEDMVLICYSSLNISEERDAARVTIDRECPLDKPSQRAVTFGHRLIQLAQKHFPDIASSELWRDELNSKP